jgi:Flp pilus assembly protein TadG
MNAESLRRLATLFARDERGASATEFAIWITVMVIPFLNVIDLGFYTFRTMQVREAAQAGAEFVSTKCGYAGSVPVATKCTTLTDANIQSAMQTTSLGANVTLDTSGTTVDTTQALPQDAGPTEGYYCVNRSLALKATSSSPWQAIGGNAGTQLSNCSTNSTGNTGVSGDYVFVTANYTYRPIFSLVSLLSVLRTSTIVRRTVAVRVG